MTAPPKPPPVLIVDDEPVIRKVAQLALTGAGYPVSEAGGTAAAVAAVRSANPPFALVLLDLTLPDGDGAAVIPEIRRLAPVTRVLVVSGVGQMDPAEVGADGFLAKPFTKSSLLAAVRQALGGPGVS